MKPECCKSKLETISMKCVSVLYIDHLCRCKFGQLGPGKGQFNSPHGFCLGLDEDIIVADTNNHRIQVFEKTGEFKYQFGIPGICFLFFQLRNFVELFVCCFPFSLPNVLIQNNVSY